MMGLPDCKEVSLQLSEACDRPLRRSLGIRLHLMICAACRTYARQIRWLRNTVERLRHAEAMPGLDESARRRIADRLREEEDRRD
ncbi:MAG TPA: zf-HC2 domain-containing protein [Gammaproteobacteria bacterium]|nr:zf-HC2 domain-containing protein [Gammaproteobacteria bacterium]